MAIEITQDMLSRLKVGLMSGEPPAEMERLARDAAIGAASIETLVTVQ